MYQICKRVFHLCDSTNNIQVVMYNKKFALLYKNCIIVQGVRHNIICDLQRKRYLQIPTHLVSILKSLENNDLETVCHQYDKDGKANLTNFLNFLEEENYLFFTDELEFWEELNLQWFPRGFVTNAVVDLAENHMYYQMQKKIIQSLTDVGCRFVQFRFLQNQLISEEKLRKELEVINNSNLLSIEIVIRYNSNITLHSYKDICIKFPKITIVVYDSKAIKGSFIHPRFKIVSNTVESEKCCGIVDKRIFEIHTQKFTESLNYNSCLNRKISIDKKGNIKNCPSMSQSFGNIKDTTLEEALDHPDFKKYWNITKDQINVCKDCEFRYVCTDCRAYTETPEDIYAKPLKCGYDPYTGKWEEWSTHPMKQKAIDYYEMRELVDGER